MPETVEVLGDLAVIQIRFFGAVTEEDLLKSRESVSKIYQELKLTKVLVDATAVTSLPRTLSIFDHGVSLSGTGLPSKAKFAVVISEAVKNDAYFLETVARNRSANLKNFESREEALAWLKA